MSQRIAAALLFILCATLPTFSPAAAVYYRYTWSIDGSIPDTATATFAACQAVPGDSSCPASPGAAMTSINSGTPITYRLFGRIGQGAAVNPSNGGYRINVSQNNSSAYGFAWMAFVWLDKFSSSQQAVLWAEGIDPQTNEEKADFAITVGSTGIVMAAIGHNGVWAHYLFSTNKIGVKAWHHVALVWDTRAYYLLLDGVPQGTVSDSMPPDESSQVPVAVGAFYSGGSPKFLLNGSVDEVKFVKFTPGMFYTAGDAPSPGSAGNFVLNEAGLELRKVVISDLITRNILTQSDMDMFSTPTFAATSVLRAYVNSFFNSTMARQPLETLSGLSMSSVENYVFPINGVDPLGQSPPSTAYSLFMRVRAPVTYGYCETAALTLWGIYKAFGYAVRKYDWMSGPDDFEYTNSHALVEVYTEDPALGVEQYVMQDPTYNISGRDDRTSPAVYDNVMDLYELQVQPPAVMPFDDNGYSYNQSPIWMAPVPSQYFPYFNSPTSILNSWSH